MTGRALAVAAALILIGAWGRAASAQGRTPTVQIQAERSTVTVGEPFMVRISISSEGGSAMVSLPPGSPFELLGRGSTSSSFQMSTGFGSSGMQISRQESFQWQLRALRPGRHTLGPLVVQVDGQQYRAGTTSIEALAGPGGQASQPAPPFSGLPPSSVIGTPVPQPGQPLQPGQLPGQIDPTTLEGAVFDNELFLRTAVEPSEAYVGQQVVMTIYLYTTLNLANVSVEREASTDGFWSEDLLGPSRRLQFQDQFVGQQHFRVAELRRMALFPLREGTLTIGVTQVEATTGFRSLFNPRSGTVVRQGVPVQVRVRPLPEKGRPAGFEDGNVGRFELEGSLDRQTTKVGEPVTLTLTVRGQGHLRNVKLPPVGEIEGARVYEPRVSDAVLLQAGQLGGERRWEVLILPQKEGRLEIPSIALGFFDPVDEEYKTARSEARIVEVGAGEAGAAASTEEPLEVLEGRSEGDDRGELGPLHTIRRQSALSLGARPIYASWWFVLVLVLAPAGFALLVLVQRIRSRNEALAGVTRSRRAAQVARKALEQVKGDGDEVKGDGGEGLGQVTRALNGFLLDRFSRGATGQTMEELGGFLLERGASEELARRVVEVMERCERGRFGGGRESAAALAREAAAIVSELDALRSGTASGEAEA